MSFNYDALSASDGNGEPGRATVQSPGRSIGSTTIPVDATTNWPTGTFIATTGTLLSTGKLDPTTTQVFFGTASGTNITISSFAPGYTDKGNAVGDVVVIKPSTEWADTVANAAQSTSKFPAQFANFVEPTGGVWTQSSGLIGQQSAGYVWYQGVRDPIPAVTSYTFTASQDTYVDFNPSTSAFTYVPETNGATEPAVTSGCVRVAKIVTNASAIANIYQKRYQSPIVANSVLSSMLALSNSLAPETGVQSTPNTGTGGGTIYYLNLGGVKLAWGITTSNMAPGGGIASCSVVPPSGFFSTLQNILVSAIQVSGDNRVVVDTTGSPNPSGSNAIVGWNTANSTSTLNAAWLMIGT